MRAENNIGVGVASESTDPKTIRYINLKLALLGFVTAASSDPEFDEMRAALMQHQHETDRLLADYLCPADQRIQTFLNSYLAGTGTHDQIARADFRPGSLRSGPRDLPAAGSRRVFLGASDSLIASSRGCCTIRGRDRRTTHGIFHVAEGGLGIPDDKRGVPKEVFRPDAAAGA